jgi:hypothetical protein
MEERKWNERASKNNVRSQKAETEELEIDDPKVINIIYIFLIISRSGAVVGRDPMVVGFTTTYAISSYRH